MNIQSSSAIGSQSSVDNPPPSCQDVSAQMHENVEKEKNLFVELSKGLFDLQNVVSVEPYNFTKSDGGCGMALLSAITITYNNSSYKTLTYSRDSSNLKKDYVIITSTLLKR